MDKIQCIDEKSSRDKLIMTLMIVCGLRSIEVTRLDIGDIETRQGKYFLRIWGKARAGKNDLVPLPRALYEKIKSFVENFRTNAKKNAPLFVSTSRRCKNARLQTQTISRLAKKYLNCAGFSAECYTCHSLRHSYANIALSQGANLRDIQAVMRHKSLTVTEVYLHDNRIIGNATTALVSTVLRL